MNVLAILGPTASGKSAIGEAAAARFGASILSVDSMQVYRGMDIGTAKPSRETRSEIDHYMIDIADPKAEFSVAEFQTRGREALAALTAKGRRVIIVGGSGLHFRALVDPLTFAPTDPEIRGELEAMSLEALQQALLAIDHHAPEVVDVHNPRRLIRAIEVWRITSRTPSERSRSDESKAVRAYVPMIEHASIGVDAGPVSTRRAATRFMAMLDRGLLEEVRSLAGRMGRSASQAVGYKELLDVVAGVCTIEDAATDAIRATNALVKRQRTFFGRDPRIEWVPWQDDEDGRINDTVQRAGEVVGWTS